MEIQFFHEKAVKTNPRLMDECIRKMGSGEAPFFPTKLGLVYDKLVTKAPFDTHPSGPTEGKSPIRLIHSPRALTSTRNINISLTVGPATSSSNLQTAAPTCDPDPLTTTTQSAWLRCIRCYKAARLQDLYKGLRCPQCPSVNGWKRPIMQCTSCNLLRSEASRECAGKKCGRRFM